MNLNTVSNQTSLLLAGFTVGDRVQVAPHLDCWMAGDRLGTVENMGRFYLHVRMDRSGRLLKLSPENVVRVEAGS